MTASEIYYDIGHISKCEVLTKLQIEFLQNTLREAYNEPEYN